MTGASPPPDEAPASDEQAAEPTRLRKRSVTIAGHRTSLSLEDAFWEALKGFAREDGVTLAQLIERIDQGRQGNLSSALRVYALERSSSRS